jgi:YebC/PmpR family DNA-binding regulatory protein
MSGHSHYATIKRQKGLKDAARGKIFSKMARAIAIAVKAGGNSDPEANYKLRMVVDAARAVNMPKENIERAITRAGSEAENLEEVTYEGFAGGGVGVIVEAATDNRNRTAQEIKNIFERGGGNLAGPGSVSFNFEPKGLIVIKKKANKDEQILTLIDAGVEDFEETDDAIEVYVSADKLNEVKKLLEAKGFEIISFELVRKPKNMQDVSDLATAQKVLKLLDSLEEDDDVQKVYANVDIPDEILQKIGS